jgi:hypothetical protein
MREPTPPQNPAVAAAARAKLAPHERAVLDERAEARARWSSLARLGRRGYALTGTGIVAVALFASSLPHGLWQAPSWADLVHGFRSIGPWGIAFVVPVLVGCYAWLLQRFDRYRRMAGDPPEPRRLSLDRWRDEAAPDDGPADAAGT